MTELEQWLVRATRYLSRDAAAQVRTEIREHYDSAREAAVNGGASDGDADQVALRALGDARQANRQYRKVLLTAAEARLLRQGNWESRVVCSNPSVKSLLRWTPAAVLLAAGALHYAGAADAARILLIAGLGMGLLFSLPFLPVYTPQRARLIRCVKWVVLSGILVLAFGADAMKLSWLLFACLWPMAWVEWKRTSIRRKLPVALWPKHLYL